MSNEYLKEISRKLDIIIRLIILQQIKNKPVKEQIIELYKLGFSNKEIARMLGKSESHVAKEISIYRKQIKEESG